MLGIIGGSGLYELENLNLEKKHNMDTPFGEPSETILEANLEGETVFFLARHGKNHTFLPHEINYRANIYALKKLGVKNILSVSAVGSLKEEVVPGDFILARQYLDFTKSRQNTFFSSGLNAHIASNNAVCNLFSNYVSKIAEKNSILLKDKATYVGVEGPRFGTKAESLMFRQLGADIVGMTNVPEAFLALEASISYASICIVTDYDCWKETEVNVSSALKLYMEKVTEVKSFIYLLIKNFYKNNFSTSFSRTSLENAFYGNKDNLSKEQKSLLELLKL